MSGAALFWLSVTVLAVASLAATAVHALREFSRAQLRDLLRKRNLPARYDDIVEHQPSALLAAESLRVLATAVAVLAGGGFFADWYAAQANPPELWVSAVLFGGIGTALLWLALVWLPTAIAQVWSERFLARTWPVWNAASKLLMPSILAGRGIAQLLRWFSGRPAQSLTEAELEQEIREVVTEGEREGLLEEDAREMIESVISLGDVQVVEIMTPRTDMISMSADLIWNEALTFVINSGHTRIPVYGKSRDEIVGILHIKDMLQEMAKESQTLRRPIATLLRPPFFVPETKSVDSLLQEFQRGRNHIAVVLDEYGGVSGLVTIEDVLEEIVGEIADEHDEAAADGIKPTGDHSGEAFARLSIYEINEHFKLNLPENDHFDSIGGLVFHELGRIPHAGEEVVLGNVKIKVLEATRRRINRVSIEVLPSVERTPVVESAGESVDA